VRNNKDVHENNNVLDKNNKSKNGVSSSSMNRNPFRRFKNE
jgi:hypothetical protein